LLIVGDPLCRPWADIPQVSVTGVQAGDEVRGRLLLQQAATLSGLGAIETFLLAVDGRYEAECRPGGTLPLDTTKLCDGYHELRVLAIGPPPIESQGSQIVPVRVNNRGRQIAASLATLGPQPIDRPVVIAARSPGSIGIVILQGSRVVAHLPGPEGRIEIAAKTLGSGPVQLRVEALGEGTMQTNVIAPPLDFVIQ
jgi:hypothetical protein